MFKDKYSKDNEQIVPDEAVKRYIKTKLLEKNVKTSGKINYNAIVAVCLSCFLLMGVIFTAKITSNAPVYVGESTLKQDMTYDTVYDSIDALLKANRNSFFDYLVGGISLFSGGAAKDVAEPESAVTTGLGDDGTGTSSNSSNTNNQVEGVDETDLVKNDGKYIYSLKDDYLIITDSNNGEPKVVTKKLVSESGKQIRGLFVNENRLAVILDDYRSINFETTLLVFDISDKANVTELKELKQSGSYANSRMIGDTVYLLSNYIVRDNITKSKPESYVPCIDGKTVEEKDICMIDEFESPTYLVISAIDLKTGESLDSEAVLGDAENVYCDDDNLYYTFSKYGRHESDTEVVYKTETTVVKLSLSPNDIKTVATGVVDGRPLNQFSMDEYENNLRIVTTVDLTTTAKQTGDYSKTTSDSIAGSSSRNALYVLDEKLSTIGSIENLAEGERVYSVRFDGKTGYFVTFKQVDPLFTVDLSDPQKPEILSELKIPGFSEYLHPFGEGKLFGFGKSATEQGAVTGLKVSMFDVSDPSDVTENHVTLIDAAWSEASENHKAIMVDKNKNIIAFLGTDDFSRTNLYVYGYDEDNGFFEKAVSFVDYSYNFGTRFVWINDHFYLVSQKGITVFNMESFEKIAYLQF